MVMDPRKCLLLYIMSYLLWTTKINNNVLVKLEQISTNLEPLFARKIPNTVIRTICIDKLTSEHEMLHQKLMSCILVGSHILLSKCNGPCGLPK